MKKLTLTLALALLVQGCDTGGFKSDGAGSSTTNNSASDIGGGTPGNSEINQVDLKSTVDGGVNDGALALDMDLQSKTIILRIPMASSMIIGLPMVNAQIPQIPGATVQTVIDANGRNAVVVTIPMDKFLRGVSLGTPGRLPNGDALPAVPRGELPTVALNIDLKNNTKLYLYIGTDQAVAFVETPQFDPFKAIPNLPITIDKLILPVKNKRQQTLGYFGFIGSKNMHPGGFYLATALPAFMVQILDNYFIKP